jgi:prevent-host-death family protein
MRTIGAAEFKAHCLALLDEVAQESHEFLILKRGRPVARLLPVAPLESAPQASLLGTMMAMDDLLAPPLVADAWDAERGE